MAFGSLCISDGMPWGRCTIFLPSGGKKCRAENRVCEKIRCVTGKKIWLETGKFDYRLWDWDPSDRGEGWKLCSVFEIIFHEDEAVCLPEECDCNVHSSGNGGDAHVSGKTISERKCTDFRSVLRCWNNADRARYLSSGKGKIWNWHFRWCDWHGKRECSTCRREDQLYPPGLFWF